MEHERSRLTTEVDRLTVKLDNAKERRLELQARITELTDRAEKAEHSTVTASQQLATQTGSLSAVSRNKVGISPPR